MTAAKPAARRKPPAPAETKSPAAAEHTPTQAGLRPGRLVTYVVDDDGLERTQTGLVVDVFDVDDVAHARVYPLPAALAISVDALTPLDS
jgi:hypothetical protein